MSAAALFCTSEVSREAEDFAKKCADVSISFVTSQTLAQFAQYEIDDDTLDECIVNWMEQEREARKKALREPFMRGRMMRYFLVAAALLIASFFVRYALYYRLLAGVCISFGFTAFWLDKTAQDTERHSE